MSYDPAHAKTEQFANPQYATPQVNPIAAQPATQATTYVVGTVAPPQHAAYAQPYVSATPPVQYNGPPRRPYPRNRWGDSICDWPLNLYPSCYCVCCVCCGMYLAAQIGQKTGYSNMNAVLWAFFAFCVLGFFLQIFFGSVLIVWIPMAFAGIYAIGLRLHIVRRENITDCGANPVMGECCVAFWCWYCSVAQMARHVYGYNKVLDGDGDPFRPDSYAPMEV
mmetsp:Transcript_39117/g.28917  ORF Transcript_39117/g.28917 Transcript_39117/m.28917 type:complete len:222 (+) Transcript_39117:60-725(+)